MIIDELRLAFAVVVITSFNFEKLTVTNLITHKACNK